MSTLSQLVSFVEKTAGSSELETFFCSLRSLTANADITVHPYGFYILKSVQQVGVFELRIHVWLNERRVRQQPDWPPHSHNSDLYSFILQGDLLSREWTWQSDNQGAYRLYEVGYAESYSFLKRTADRGYLSDLTEERIGTLQWYCVKSNRIHESYVKNENLVVTLVLLSNKKMGTALVVGNNDGDKVYKFDRRHVSDEKKKKVFDFVQPIILSLVKSSEGHKKR